MSLLDILTARIHDVLNCGKQDMNLRTEVMLRSGRVISQVFRVTFGLCDDYKHDDDMVVSDRMNTNHSSY